MYILNQGKLKSTKQKVDFNSFIYNNTLEDSNVIVPLGIYTLEELKWDALWVSQ
jgi:hypothetical protein